MDQTPRPRGFYLAALGGLLLMFTSIAAALTALVLGLMDHGRAALALLAVSVCLWAACRGVVVAMYPERRKARRRPGSGA